MRPKLQKSRNNYSCNNYNYSIVIYLVSLVSLFSYLSLMINKENVEAEWTEDATPTLV